MRVISCLIVGAWSLKAYLFNITYLFKSMEPAEQRTYTINHVRGICIQLVTGECTLFWRQNTSFDQLIVSKQTPFTHLDN